MKTAEKIRQPNKPQQRQEEDGLIKFLSGIHKEVVNFDRTFEFGVSSVASPPASIDGSTEEIKNVGFLAVRNNKLLSDRTYCLYTLLKGHELHAYIGVYTKENVETIRELSKLENFEKGRTALLDWLKALVKASCEKP
jgi:hypothetical protein